MKKLDPFKIANEDISSFARLDFGRKARTGFNPKTQAKIQIPAKTVVKFRLSKVAKDSILASK